MKKWYKLKAWEELRQFVLQRDGYVCSQCGVALVPGKHSPSAAVVDHKTPHKGCEMLFWDVDNLHLLCKYHHDKDKQQIERIGYNRRIGSDGWPIDERHPANEKL